LELATLPVAWVWLVNGATLPARGVSAGLGDAAAGMAAVPIVMPTVAATAPMAAVSALVLDMVSLPWFLSAQKCR
jgi:hypothetical protein